MANKVVFNVRDDYGQLFVKNTDGSYATREQLQDMIVRLIDTYNLVADNETSQQAIYEQLITTKTGAIADMAKVVYPFAHPFAVYNHAGINRGKKQPRFSGVYIITLEQARGAVKIGMTIDLYHRTKGIRHDVIHEYGIESPVFEPLAFIHTNDHASVERMLHEKFADARIDKEWFHRAPIEEWLEQFRSAS